MEQKGRGFRDELRFVRSCGEGYLEAFPLRLSARSGGRRQQRCHQTLRDDLLQGCQKCQWRGIGFSLDRLKQLAGRKQ